MALPNTKPASNSSILYPYENPQTDLTGRPREFRVHQRSYPAAFVAILLQPLAQQQKSYLRDCQD